MTYTCPFYFLQENKAREVAEVQRRHRDRLQFAAKRRSTATCSSRDKEMDGVALESVLKNFFTNRLSRRRSGRPLSSHGSPPGGSPKNGSLLEITSQVNLPAGNQRRVASLRVKEMSKKEWSSACELTENSQTSPKKFQSHSEDSEENCAALQEDDVKTSRKENSKGLTPPINRAPRISSSSRSFSATTDDGEDELQDNNEEEAQKLRDASRKVLRFQNSFGSVSSGEFPLENQKSPAPSTTFPRQRTFDEDTERYTGDATDEELVTFLRTSQTTAKTDLGRRRHTLPTNVLQTDQGDQLPIKTSVSTASRKQDTAAAEGYTHKSINQVFDFTNVSHTLKKSQDQNSPPARKKSMPDVSATCAPDEGPGERNREDKSIKPTGSYSQRNSETIPPKDTWNKMESSGILSFFKRLGDMSRLPSSKETTHKGPGSYV